MSKDQDKRPGDEWGSHHESYLERANKDIERLRLYLHAKNDSEKKRLTNEDELIPGVILIAGGLYPVLPEAHAALLQYFDKQGYKFKDCTVPDGPNDKYFDRPAPSVQRQKGWYTGYASFKEEVLQNKAKCESCNSLISRMGVQVNGHKCESCGVVTYVELPKGSSVRFSFFSSPETVTGVKFTEGGDAVEEQINGEVLRDSCLIVERFDPETDKIYCYAELEEATKDEADYGSAAEETYRRLADFKRFDRIIVNRDDISDIWGSKRNFRDVKIFRGKEYKDWDRLPEPESFSVYEPWHWAPKLRTPNLHNEIIRGAMMVEDKGYYYQDGRAAFYDGNIESMRRYVDHFTVLDLGKWDRMMKYADRSGPGMINAIAAFCHSEANVIEKPNIGNYIIGLTDNLSGKPKTPQQVRSEILYLRSEGFDGSVDDLIKALQEIGMIPSENEKRKIINQRSWIQNIWDSLKNT